MPDIKDVFICHASEDKSTVVESLVDALDKAGISYWYSEAELKWGDSITKKVNAGFKISRYVIVILSRAFMSKNWPERELNAAMNIEASSGEVRVLPLIIGEKSDEEEILSNYPILNDKFFLSWSAGIEVIVEALQARLAACEPPPLGHSLTKAAVRTIPMPKVQKTFTQRDKDRFLRDAFNVIMRYFVEAVRELNKAETDIDVEFEEIDRYKFVCSFYVNGELSSRCKIWLGAPFSSDSIVYSQGADISITSDSSINDWLSVTVFENVLALETSTLWIGGGSTEAERVLSPEKAAEYLWMRSIQYLNHK